MHCCYLIVDPGRAIDNQEANKFRRPSTWALALILLLALVLRIWTASVQPMIQLDETVYAHMAESLNRGLGPMEITGDTSVNFMPAYPFFMAAVATVTGDYILAGHMVSIAFGVLVVLLVFILARDLAGTRVGLMAAALMAVDPLFLDFSARLYSESTFMFFLLAAVIFGRYMLLRGRVVCAALAGSALGIAYLVNPAALVYLVIFLALGAAVAYRNGAWMKLARALGAFVLLFLVFAVPYVVFLHDNLDRWTYTGKNPALIYNAEQDIRSGSPEWDEVMLRIDDDGQELFINTFDDYPDPISSLLSDPAASAKVFLRQAQAFYFEKLPFVFPLWLLPLLGAGLFGTAMGRERAVNIGYLLLMMAPGLVIFNVDSVPRYFLAYVPFALIIVAMGWRRVEDWAVESANRLRGYSISTRLEWSVRVLAALLVMVPLLLFTLVTIQSRSYPLVYKDAGLWIREQYGDELNIMSREFSTPYYAAGHVTTTPFADYDATYEFAKLKQVDLLVISREDILERRPLLAALTDEPLDHPEWVLVKTINEGADDELYIFEIDDGGAGRSS